MSEYKKKVKEKSRMNMDEVSRLLGWINGDYDYGADNQAGEYGHYSDKGKLPHHPTFSDESKYHTADAPGGSWSLANGGWDFKPTINQIQNVPGYLNSLARYYEEEKGKGIDKVTMPIPYRELAAITGSQD